MCIFIIEFALCVKDTCRILYCNIPTQTLTLSPHSKLVLMRGCHGDVM